MGLGRAGRAGWVGRGVGHAGRAGWVGRGVGRAGRAGWVGRFGRAGRAVVDWLTDRCVFHADAKSSLAVLRNRNDMTNLFRASNWVSESQDSIVSRGVTTCALAGLGVVLGVGFGRAGRAG